MSAPQPDVRTTETTLPEQREAARITADPLPLTVVDHVQAHSMRCYWDFDESCWHCSDD